MLTDKQIEHYHSNGFLILDAVFSEEEINALSENLSIFENHKNEANVICEENGSIRSIFAPENQAPLFKDLIVNPRILKPSEQLIEDKLYLHQYKLNKKEAFVGQNWEWHQDFPFWYYGDGIKSPKLISVMVILNDVKPYQGPLLVIPKSHINGIADFNKKSHLENSDKLEDSLSSDLKYTVNNDLVKELASKNGIIPFEGKKGSVFFFHPNIFHASNTNVSPFERNTAILTYNSIHNLPTKQSSRPDYISYNSFEPLSTL